MKVKRWNKNLKWANQVGRRWVDGGLGGEKNIKLNRILKKTKQTIRSLQDKIIMNEILIKTQARMMLLSAQRLLNAAGLSLIIN